MKKFKPDVVIGTGGFVCVPVMFAGHRYGARCYLHEQNAFPGVANKSLEKFATKVFLGFPEASQYFREPQKHVNVGNPVRKRFYDVETSEARANLNIDKDDFVVFSFGGSQGAEMINNVAFDLMDAINGHKGVTFYLWHWQPVLRDHIGQGKTAKYPNSAQHQDKIVHKRYAELPGRCRPDYQPSGGAVRSRDDGLRKSGYLDSITKCNWQPPIF